MGRRTSDASQVASRRTSKRRHRLAGGGRPAAAACPPSAPPLVPRSPAASPRVRGRLAQDRASPPARLPVAARPLANMARGRRKPAASAAAPRARPSAPPSLHLDNKTQTDRRRGCELAPWLRQMSTDQSRWSGPGRGQDEARLSRKQTRPVSVTSCGTHDTRRTGSRRSRYMAVG